ncbi:aminoglycoside phosphotransferase family protein [Stackebrandtia nassauensis]|uniref:Aminoglycoside phosphotransferase n=1 Tax=Stackebrandtia nassauensis (strain DSM 44728 / CIP 108903 / NRRL B-16338 / NBRC 102104 / LLR-40K-21) TaxID=446470 RepID=D3Q5A3_STANL|nr:aminoglycoside phosphotransferase family protein [Stackebrandtia nassauensis]ADD44152.1 aminoglycoside phosphotransferase [Stackebrandtia nassauensis DSM 44728]
MTHTPHADGRAGIDVDLVERLIATQFPQWSDLPVTPVRVDGWDNRTYRLGEDKTVRLPTAPGYVPAVAKENTWLPRLAPRLPVPIPVPLGIGEPGEGYPHPWSVRRWLDGETATVERIADLSGFAESVAEFLLALQAVDATDGPIAGAHSFHRGADPAYYDDQTREALARLDGQIDTGAALAVWETALAAKWDGAPRWFHGDVAGGNLLVRDGKLSAVIDFGTCGVGDPACDLVMAWTFFDGDSRTAFRRAVGQDAAMWARARGWALWKALICLGGIDDNVTPEWLAGHRRVVSAVLAEHESRGD